MLSDTDTDPETDSEIDSDADTLTDSDSEVLSTFDKLSERLIEINCLLGSSVKGTVTVLEVLSLNTTVISPVDETEKDLKSLDETSRELTSLNFSHTCSLCIGLYSCNWISNPIILWQDLNPEGTLNELIL